MRLYQKKQCLQIIELLDEAHSDLAQSTEKNQLENALPLLEQCQQSAISVGTLIENTQGEGTEAVHSLEEYCELVYQFHEQLSQKTFVNPWQMKKKLSRLLLKARDQLEHHIPTRTESVWRAASEDSDCDAFVIPIPYYARNPDGSFGEMHYEGDLYPEDVPVIHYEEYDFQARHPDKIWTGPSP